MYYINQNLASILNFFPKQISKSKYYNQGNELAAYRKNLATHWGSNIKL